VPYNEPWRCGANENTTVTFSTDVKVGGKPLKAGTYSLHMIPTAKDWTIAFNNAIQAWGSFSYDQKEDALRVTVTPRAAASHEERLLYRFDDLSDSKATLVLAWEKLAVPVAIEAETPKLGMANARQALRGTTGFYWQNLAGAAEYWLHNGGPVDEAMRLADRAARGSENYRTVTLRAAVMEKQGNAKGAAEVRAKALSVASESDLIRAGYGLLGDKKPDEAIKLFQLAVERHPDSWNAYDSLAEGLATKGDKPAAAAAYSKALALAKEPAQKKRIESALAKVK
jgi:tetratricopeptide (TPR) repeat protein